MVKFIHRALLLITCFAPALNGQDPPDNDLCSDAVSISTVPFSEPGTVTGATADEWSMDPDCNFLQVGPGKGVWYKVQGFGGGTELRATVSGMDAMLMESAGEEECGPEFSCVPGMAVGRDSDDPNGAILYTWTTVAGGMYYLYVAPTDAFPGPDFVVSITEVAPPTAAPTSVLSPPTGGPTSASDTKAMTKPQLSFLIGGLVALTSYM